MEGNGTADLRGLKPVMVVVVMLTWWGCQPRREAHEGVTITFAVVHHHHLQTGATASAV